MRTHLVTVFMFFAFSSVQTISGQTQSTTSAQTLQSDEVRRLNDRIAAQAEQLAAQQAQIDALKSSFEEQKAMLLALTHPTPTIPANPPSTPVEELSSSVQVAGGTVPSAALRQEEREAPYVKPTLHWYDKYSVRGYMQMRENNLLNSNNLYTCDQCDRSIGPNNTFFLRRMRLVISGPISEHVSFYFQPDFASASGTSQNYAQIRDAYFDVSIDKKKEKRIRFGLSKIPYGFEELQSSQNRLDFDRSDALNSAFPNERDIGVIYYWAPAHIRARFNELVNRGLKGSGDYGVFGAALINGQGLNTPEANNDFDYVTRFTYPFELHNGQFIEASLQGYTGKYTVTSRSSGTQGKPNFLYNDRRIAGSLIIYPQPLGFQAEYNWGTGPEYNPAKKYINQQSLNGGYALVNYQWHLSRNVLVIPYFRFQYYEGGKKTELDARQYLIREGELGIETQIGKYIEPTLQYQLGDRTFQDGAKPVNRQKGGLLRLQFQFNY